MCRWLAYSGSPVPLSEVLYTPIQSFLDQSLHSKLGAETTTASLARTSAASAAFTVRIAPAYSTVRMPVSTCNAAAPIVRPDGISSSRNVPSVNGRRTGTAR